MLLLVMSAKRLHDLNASSWRLLPLYGGPYAIGLVGNAIGESESQLGERMASPCNWTIMIVVPVPGLLPGSKGPNRFGVGLARES